MSEKRRKIGSKHLDNLLQILLTEAAYRYDENELLPYEVTEESVFTYKVGNVELNKLI